jgi:hypothetical protein
MAKTKLGAEPTTNFQNSVKELDTFKRPGIAAGNLKHQRHQWT